MERTGRFGRGWSGGWLAACVLLLAPAAGSGGGGDPATRCEAAKHKVLADYVACREKATVRGILKEQPPAVAGCDQRFLQRWQAVEEKGAGSCPPGSAGFGTVGNEAQAFLVKANVAIRPPERIVVFDSGVSATGNLDGIGGPRCEHAFDETFGCRAARRVVAVGGDDLISPPGHFAIPYASTPLYSRSGVKIADSWEDFTDGDWDACLQQTPGPDCDVAAGVLPDDTLWWHGAEFDGTGGVGENCFDFGVQGSFASGNVGISSGDGQGDHASPWGDEVASCDGADLAQEPHVLCVCY